MVITRVYFVFFFCFCCSLLLSSFSVGMYVIVFVSITYLIWTRIKTVKFMFIISHLSSIIMIIININKRCWANSEAGFCWIAWILCVSCPPISSLLAWITSGNKIKLSTFLIMFYGAHLVRWYNTFQDILFLFLCANFRIFVLVSQTMTQFFSTYFCLNRRWLSVVTLPVPGR